ncbi:phosphoribosyltransferase family protein [Flavobacteriaceae bacterium S356]|uniref:Phosphoribosyltransferase family protein n=1 Tax=Asprobacillus argus TaxID=3076534 RepID=A0ABU3LC54_9FLAO|nr:phosphoribosyltransferase family protein [Flavobacteriaceae bacterium S356]
MQFLKDIYSLFYPKICICCKNLLLSNEILVCTICRHDLPIICYTDFKKNKITDIFYGKIHIENANTLLHFQKEGKVKELIHNLKYRGRQEVGAFLGNWFGSMLADLHVLGDIDIIIPVPLHKKKKRKRGYNQLTTFGESISKILHKPYTEDILVRTSFSKTQTFKNRMDRFLNTTSKFYLKDTLALKNKHVLLVDDVITTGATLTSCCLELQKVEGIKISIITMAFAE